MTRHLLQQVGQLLVVQGGRDLVAAAGRQALDRGSQVGRLQFTQLSQLLGQRVGLEQLRVLVPGHDLRAAVQQAPAVRDGQHADLPADPLLLAGADGVINDGPVLDVLPVQLRGQDLPGPAGEAVQVHGPAAQVGAIDGDLRDQPQVDEDAAPLQRHHQAQCAGRFFSRAGQDHHVMDPADGQAVAVQQRAAPQPGREYLMAGHGPASPPCSSPDLHHYRCRPSGSARPRCLSYPGRKPLSGCPPRITSHLLPSVTGTRPLSAWHSVPANRLASCQSLPMKWPEARAYDPVGDHARRPP